MRMVTSQRSFSSANQRVRPTTALNSNHIYFYDQQFNYFPGQRDAFGSTELRRFFRSQTRSHVERLIGIEDWRQGECCCVSLIKSRVVRPAFIHLVVVLLFAGFFILSTAKIQHSVDYSSSNQLRFYCAFNLFRELVEDCLGKLARKRLLMLSTMKQ